jgi:SAM-dependent methyltransferase
MMKAYPYPEFFARFYDIIYQHLRYGEDHQFYLSEIRKTNGPVLEVGVGTGRFFKDALDQGADIYGIDVSESMLEILRGSLNERDQSRISLQNAVDFAFPGRFDLIIAPFRMFMHLLEVEDQMAALRNIRNHLSEEGLFIFDVFVPDLELLKEGLTNIPDFEGEYEPGKALRRYVTSHPDLIAQLLQVTFKLEWEEKSGLRQETWDVPMRFFFRYELEHLVERAEYSKHTIYGDFKASHLQKNSKEFVVVCRK